jgi:hypothetical protein
MRLSRLRFDTVSGHLVHLCGQSYNQVLVNPIFKQRRLTHGTPWVPVCRYLAGVSQRRLSLEPEPLAEIGPTESAEVRVV